MWPRGGRKNTPPVAPGSEHTATPFLRASLLQEYLPAVITSHRSIQARLLKVICSCGRGRQHLILAPSVWCHQRHFPVSCRDVGIVRNICFLSHLPRCLWCPDNRVTVALHVKAQILPTSQTLAGILSPETDAAETLGIKAGSRLLKARLGHVPGICQGYGK